MIFCVDDGATYWISAIDAVAARKQWMATLADEGYDAVGAVADLGEPVIRKLQLTEAAGVSVRDDDHTKQCPECCGTGVVVAERTLLEVWQEDNKLPPERQAKHGVLACSEW